MNKSANRFRKNRSSKPPYHISSMREIECIRGTNGLSVVSTFSGCGGSCLGFEMAGYRILWASEFIPAAREVYALNHPGVILDDRDIRLVKPEEILDAIGLRKGELDILEGSPPCASFSTAGKCDKYWGEIKKYSDVKQRTDDLFFEYVRLLEGLYPKVFIAENVSGLVKGKAVGYFKEILSELRSKGYRVEARMLDAQWLGVPQARQRIIFQGIRGDLNLDPVWPIPLPYRYSVTDAIDGIKAIYTGKDRIISANSSSPTILSSDGGRNSPSFNQGLGRVRARITPGLDRDEYPPDIMKYAIGEAALGLKPGEKSLKYFNLVRAREEAPSPTICASYGQSSIASVIHPIETRKFTIPELKRICGFPDDFILTGSYAQRWERLGRSVPPPMMRAVAETIRDRILSA